ncbi:FMN-linked oxidoreductase [Patellaria atrata CBS 101060]|uniref:Dihydroorotate dehydrogenase (quinone), mitochondrial n=1 Tax=Patellaria atrata CBS 101060 TaxID=1346257 RepID=A0A9P4S4A1_9PEZI|nr:FMN-linked oxidoreductase [Patellaria atrata CBS 101060]
MINRALLAVPLRLQSRSSILRHQWHPHLRQFAPKQLNRVQPYRFSSSSTTTTVIARPVATRVKNFIYGTSLILALTFTYLYTTDNRSAVHQWLIPPALRYLFPDAEDAHHAGTRALKFLYAFGLHPRERNDPYAVGDLQVEVFGHMLDNPIGVSAGLDKDAEVPDPLFALGPGIVEVGGITPRPQDGNERPRVWRLPSQNALINRYGLNSEGAEHVAMVLRQRMREFAYHRGYGIGEDAEKIVLDGEAGVPPGSLRRGRLLAVQIAKNKNTPDQDIEAVERDYVACVQHLGRYSDIVVVNVSSPNTPGLRQLQNLEPLTHILTGVVQAAKSVDRKTKPAVMVKVSPDEDSDAQIGGICKAVWASGVDGVIVGNTTKKRPDPLPKGYLLPPKEANVLLEQGGYSGPQMFERTLALVKRYRKLLDEGPRNRYDDDEPENQPKPTNFTTEGSSEETSVLDTIKESVKRNMPGVKPEPEPDTPGSQPLVRLPERHSTRTSPQSASQSAEAKVIFATGGITNGAQALEVLNAGASVAMIYTALVYGGSGTVTRVKGEMREQIKKIPGSRS